MEEESHESHLICPFYAPEGGGSMTGTHLAAHGDARRCRGAKCAIWIGSSEEGCCSFVAIAQALSKPALDLG